MILIQKCWGYELEKTKRNTSEDFFNKSEVTFVDQGKEKTLTILYVRYFDEKMTEFTPFTEDPLFEVNGRSVYFRDIVGIVCLIKNPAFRHRKRVYINNEKEFADYFKDVDYEKIKSIFAALETKGSYELSKPVEYVVQP